MRLFAMKQILVVVLLLCSMLMAAQEKKVSKWLTYGVRVPEVTVVAKRPLKEIGVQQTRLDSLVLNESVALSMADVLTFNSSIFVDISTFNSCHLNSSFSLLHYYIHVSSILFHIAHKIFRTQTYT